jgi:FKBP-type peptidyl-prolyl cis-trans isomerase FkpA
LPSSEYGLQLLFLQANQKLMKQLVAVISLAAQTKVPVKPAAPKILLKTLNDSASYIIGVSQASFAKKQGLSKLNTPLITKGCNDVLGDKPALLPDNLTNDLVTRLSIQLKENKLKSSKAAVKPVKQTSLLKSLGDSASYAIGSGIAGFYKQYGITQLNAALVGKAFSDVLGNKPVLLPETLVNAILNKYITQLQEDKVKFAIDEGKEFLATNKKRPEVKTTASGLQYEVIKEGTGIKPTAADTFVCHYRGTLINGTEFDNSYNRGQPLIYPVGGVIPGWTEGLQLMPVGSKYKFYIPYTLGYGVFGSPPGIPGGSMLIFEVELLDVKKPGSATPGKPN